MIIGEAKVAYPYARFTAHVSHFTARDSTAIEWMILEAIDRCAKLPEYGNWPAGTIFQEMFMIADPNLIILPCLLILQDLGAVESEGISDETDLDEVRMRDLRLTEKGVEMQHTGKLPGRMNMNLLQTDYELTTDRLIPALAGKNAEEPDGIPAVEMASSADVPFPSAQIRDMLELERKTHPKGDGRFSWLLASTRIDNIAQAGVSVFWRSTSKNILLGPGMECKFEGEDDPRLNALALETLLFSEPEETELLPSIQAADPDREFDKVFRTDQIAPLIRERLNTDARAVVNQRYASNGSAGSGKKDAGIRILAVQGCEMAAAVLRNKQLVIEVPERLLPEGTVYASPETRICVGKCKLHAAGAERNAVISFVPSSGGIDVESLIADTAVRHAEEAPLGLLTLYAMGHKGAFLGRIWEMCGRRARITEKNKLLQELNQAWLQSAGQKCISQAEVAEILVDPDHIRTRCTDIDGALAVLAEYEAIPEFRQRDELYREVLRQILSLLPQATGLTDLYRLWEHVAEVKRSHMNWVNQGNLFQRLYSKPVIHELLDAFPDDGFFSLALGEYTAVEKALVEMRQAVGDVIECLPELEDSWDRESVREAVLAHKEHVRRFQSDIRTWRDAWERFEVRIGPMEEYVRPGSGFADMTILMDRVADVLAMFLEDSAVKYGSIVVADTCALMNRPELISWFDDGKTMLVIPQTVLGQLDGKKMSEDEDEAYKAREAIRQIDNYRSFQWLNLGEVSDPSLLNRDLDPHSSDNLILSVALRYIVKLPILLTDDINFRNIASAQPGLTAMDTTAYEMKKKHEAENRAEQQGKKGKKKNKKKK